MDRHLLEIKPRGSFLFPFERYPTIDETGTFFVSCHYHPEIEIMLIQHGSVTLFVDGQTSVVAAGTIVFLNQEEIHGLTSNAPQTQYDAFVFPLDLLSFPSMDYCQQNHLLPLIQKKYLFPRFVTPDHVCYDFIQTQLLALSQLHSTFPEGYQMATKAALYQILAQLIMTHSFLPGEEEIHPADSKRLTAMRGIISYIQEHLTEKISLSDISTHFHMTPNYFCKYFKDSFGMPFTSYLNGVRLERAGLLLTETDCSIMEVSMQSGFDNLSYFIRLFKERNGTTPSQYRKALSHSVYSHF